MGHTAFQGRRAVITGAASGLGRALAFGLARRGVEVVACDRDEGGLAETVAAIVAAGGTCEARAFDVCDVAAWVGLRDALDQRGGVQIVVNNAGVALTGPFLACSLEDIDWQLDVNVRGVVLGCHTLLPLLLREREAHLVNISSLFGILSMPDNAAYCMSKHAVKALSECLMAELPPHVSVTSVHPGAIATGIVTSGRFREGGRLDERQARKVIARGLSPEQAAEIVLAGVEAKRSHVIVGRDAVWLARLQRWFPQGHRELIRLAMAWPKRRSRGGARAHS